jgi:hypothetical protein
MILIFSERSDLNTRRVLSYLNYYEASFELFLEDDTIEFTYRMENNAFHYTIYKNTQKVCTDSEITSVWFRRTDIRVSSSLTDPFPSQALEVYSKEHVKTRYSQIQRCLNQKRCLGKFGYGNYNKIEFIEKCITLNILIPRTLITNSKDQLVDFIKSCSGEIITKSLSSPYESQEFDELGRLLAYHLGYTASIKESDLNVIPNEFDLSLFQEKLDKFFEIRTIYINGKTFSQAIFSQSRDEAVLDYRLGYQSGMRTCNYSLPQKIEKQVQELMHALDLNFGSLDIVVTSTHEYVFLEVNPCGQYGAVSDVINSNIDFEVASFLLN